MKRALSFFVVFVFFVQLSGCGVHELMTRDSNQIDAMSEEIIRCLIEKDRDALAELFCGQVRDTAAFDSQLDALYAFFDYDCFIRYDIDGDHAQSEARENGERVEWSVRARIVYIQVADADGSYFYGIEYLWTPIYHQDESLVGLHSITVHLLNTDQQSTVGTDQNFSF